MARTKRVGVPAYVTVVHLQEAADGAFCYVAYHPELPTCMSQGDTAAEVEATRMALAHLASGGLPAPAPLLLLSFSPPARDKARDALGAPSDGVWSGVLYAPLEARTAPAVEIRELPTSY